MTRKFTTKSGKAYGLKKNKKFQDTLPERQTEYILKSIEATFDKQVEIKTNSWNYPFTADFVVFSIPARKFDKPCVVETNGPYHYRSKRQLEKVRWRTTCITNEGYPVILIDSEWLGLDDIVERLLLALNNVSGGTFIHISDIVI